MKKFFALVFVTFMLAAPCMGQKKTLEEYYERYSLIVNRFGVAGIGIETLINSWEKDYPEDIDMLTAKFNYYFNKSQGAQIVRKDRKKFMGNQPKLSLTDSLGNPVFYFEETFYNDSLYAIASQTIDKAIRLNPRNLDLRFAKVTSQMAYEKESPDMALSTLKSLIDYNYTSHPVWLYGGEVRDNDFFASAVQEYCYSFYLIDSPVTRECFREISEKMIKYNPDRTEFLSNIGSYYLSAKDDSKEALKYYNKVLKINRSDYAAIKNCVIIARKNRDVKLEKKYLPMLIAVTTDENEKASAQARLNSFKANK